MLRLKMLDVNTPDNQQRQNINVIPMTLPSRHNKSKWLNCSEKLDFRTSYQIWAYQTQTKTC